jgi:cytochrome c biogenesis protein ResB
MKTGSPSPRRDDYGHHLDLVAYWQEQCRRLQTECDVLRSENIKLERSNQLLTSAPCQTHDGGGHSKTAQASKRKAPMASTVRASKRIKASQLKTSEQAIIQTQEAIEDDYDFLDGLGDGKPKLHQTVANSTTQGMIRTNTKFTNQQQQMARALPKLSS